MASVSSEHRDRPHSATEGPELPLDGPELLAALVRNMITAGDWHRTVEIDGYAFTVTRELRNGPVPPIE